MIRKIVLCLSILLASLSLVQAAEVKEKVEFELKAGVNDYFYGDFAGSNVNPFDDPAAAFGVSYWLNNHFAIGGEYNWSKAAISDGVNVDVKTDYHSLNLLLKYRLLANSKFNVVFNMGAGYLFYDLAVFKGGNGHISEFEQSEYVIPFGVTANYMINDMFSLNLQAQNFSTFSGNIDAHQISTDPEGYVNLTAGVSMYLDANTDKDMDGISNSKDKCPDLAEDKDGFEDSDGCPDLDNDKDGVADLKDKSPNLAEDKDGFEDTDGSPDLDNDKDGIADLKDKSPNEAEDKDGFEDSDGSPDLDNDKDGILDTVDKAPNEAEDSDGFEDEDGIPDLDNDKDGILDTADKCPNEAETMNGFKDEDGCPDAILKKNDKITLNNIYFQLGKSELTAESYTELLKVERMFVDNPNLVIQIEGHTDSQGNAAKNKTLSAKRAEAIKKYIIDKFGVAKEKLSTVGYGSEKPVSSNKTPEGRSLNRRIEFKIIKN